MPSPLAPLSAARRTALVCVLATLVFGSASPSSGQSRRVRAWITATTASGAPVEALTPNDIVVREDGVIREVLTVKPATTPALVMLLVDDTAAADAMALERRRATRAFIDTLHAETAVGIMTFGDRPTRHLDPTTRREDIVRALLSIFPRPGAGSYVVDAIRDAADALRERNAARAAIVVISGAGPEFSQLQATQAIAAVKRAGAALYVVAVGEPDAGGIHEPEVQERARTFDLGTSESGGERLALLSPHGLEATLTRLARELNAQWDVVYARPDALIQPSTTSVTSSRTNLRVRGTRSAAADPE